MVADLLGLSPEDGRIAVAVGIGAGIGAIFKAPLGGALLVAEILYRRDMEVKVIYPALVASAVGYSIFGSVVGSPPYSASYTEAFNPAALPLYAVLGAAVGLVGLLYIRSFYGIHNAFKRLRVSPYLKPALGGLLTGAIALLVPEVMGVGYGWISLLEYGRLDSFPSAVHTARA
jgi:CIC family chloride channel protein